jgi:hypothetical protein
VRRSYRTALVSGFAYLPVYPARANRTVAAVGCPVSMTGPRAASLFLQVT